MKTSPILDTLPAEGGTYERQSDGSLLRIDTPMSPESHLVSDQQTEAPQE